MEYTDDFDKIKRWAPLLCQSRDQSTEKIACTYVAEATDVDFGALTKFLAKSFQTRGSRENSDVLLHHTIKGLKQEPDGKWLVKVAKDDLSSSGFKHVRTKFLFVGAGGATIQVLQKSGIPEIKGFGGFPISGQFLVCQNPDIVKQHPAKIYGKAAVGAPPMSVPHLDARIIDGKPML